MGNRRTVRAKGWTSEAALEVRKTRSHAAGVNPAQRRLALEDAA
ncbi:hypothetical protein [Rubrivirga sp.]